MKPLMLLVTYAALPGPRDAFLSEVAAAGLQSKIQQEDGCLRYDYFRSVQDADELLLVEVWASEAQQKQHMQHSNMVQLTQIKNRHIASTKLDRVSQE